MRPPDVPNGRRAFHGGTLMIHIKVQYDEQTRSFQLVDEEDNTLLDGDALYDLAVPLLFEEVEDEDTKNFISAGSC
jgi:hypothetical protein